ncbi:glucuronate isomerase, partial [Pseudomonas aeruginosa]|nr:glucuronate isomerase [Pseudomonas aeruginosa]
DIDVVPSWRPDKIFKIELPTFNDYIQQLAEVADIEITNFSTLQQAILKRLDHFEQHGCKSADHGIEIVRFADIPTEQELDKILHHRRQH